MNSNLQVDEQYRYPLSQAVAYYIPGYISNPKEVLDDIINNVPFTQGQVKLGGNIYNERRLTALYGDDQNAYKYSGKSMQKMEWDPVLLAIRNFLYDNYNAYYDTLLVNYYRDGNDSISMHWDKEIKPDSSICSISLGASRYFDIHAKDGSEKHRIELHSGDLFIMGSGFHTYYKHGVPVQKKVTQPRINLTYRVDK